MASRRHDPLPVLVRGGLLPGLHSARLVSERIFAMVTRNDVAVADERDQRGARDRSRDDRRTTSDDDPTRAIERPPMKRSERREEPGQPGRGSARVTQQRAPAARPDWDDDLPDSIGADAALANMVKPSDSLPQHARRSNEGRDDPAPGGRARQDEGRPPSRRASPASEFERPTPPPVTRRRDAMEPASAGDPSRRSGHFGDDDRDPEYPHPPMLALDSAAILSAPPVSAAPAPGFEHRAPDDFGASANVSTPDRTMVGRVVEGPPPPDRTRVGMPSVDRAGGVPPSGPPLVPASQPEPAEKGRGRPRLPGFGPRRARRIIRWTAIIGVLLCLMEFGYLFWMVRSMEHVSTDGSLNGGSANILMVGSDTRTGTDQEGLVSGQRSDTLLILRLSGGSATMMSIPRDLWVQLDGGGENRVNVAYQRSPAALIRTIQNNLKIPIHHYMEVDFVTFALLVDALGGVTIDFPYPATDVKSGFLVTAPGAQRLDGTQALAYVRSRTYTEFIGDQQVVDPTGDLGRVQRQQAFLRSLMRELLGIRTPWTLNSAVSALTSGLRVDGGFGMLELMRMAWALKSGSPTSIELPTTPFTTSGGAAVLSLREPDADQALSHFR